MYYQMTTQGHTNMLNEGYCDTIFFIICYIMDDYYHRMKRKYINSSIHNIPQLDLIIY